MLLDDHVEALCREMGIERFEGRRGRAHIGRRVLIHPPIHDEMDYLVALHELGHFTVGLRRPRLEREAAAWAWALETSCVEPSFKARQRICANLVRYLYRARARGWRVPEDGAFWELVRWWE